MSFRESWRRRNRVLTHGGAVCLCLTILAASLAWGQSGTRSGAGAQQGSSGRATTQPSFEQRFWDYLQAMHYENWAPLPGEDADFYPGQRPHGDFLKLYANRIAAGAPQELPYGSIVVKENYAHDQKSLMAITVMYRSKDYDPKANDWYWVKYEPSGKVSSMQGKLVAGKVKMCADCHRSAAGDDFVFAND